VAKLVDAPGLGPDARNGVGVRVPPRAPVLTGLMVNAQASAPPERTHHTMSLQVETLEKLERRLTLAVPSSTIETEVQARLKKLARKVKADGFRPGKVPLPMVTKWYGASVRQEVTEDKVNDAVTTALRQTELKVAGVQRVTEQDASNEDLVFDVVFEVYPDIQVKDLSAIEIERVSAVVNDAAIDKTLHILRQQKQTFHARVQGEPAQVGDQVTVDFDGTINGEPFPGGKASSFEFVIGGGQMLAQFDEAVRGMKAGDSKTFPLAFPADYQEQTLAGKEADFLVTINKIQVPELPELDDAFAASLVPQADSNAPITLQSLRDDIQQTLDRQVKQRVLQINKDQAFYAVEQSAAFDAPKVLILVEAKSMMEAAFKNFQQQTQNKTPLTNEYAQQLLPAFEPAAEKRVRLSLAANEIVRQNQLQAKPEQLQAYLEELAQDYEDPAEVIQWHMSSTERMGQARDMVMERNLVEFMFGAAKVTDKVLTFEELMARSAQSAE
jgi:trigger factor